MDNKIRFLDVSKGVVERTFDAHAGRVLHIECFSNGSQNATHCFTLCDQHEVLCWQLATAKVVSRTTARGSASTLFLLDDRNSQTFTSQLLPLLVDPEGITVVAAKEDSIKFQDPDLSQSLALIAASTPVLLI